MLTENMFALSRPRRWLLLLLVAGALFRVLFLLEARARSPAWGILLLDAEVYDMLARQIAAGDWLAGREVFSLPPLYPYLLAGLYRLGLGFGGVVAVQAALGLGSLALIFSLGREAFSARVGLLAVLLCLLYAPFPFEESKLMGTTLGVFLGLAALRLLLAAWKGERAMLWAGAGALLGLTCLVRPETLLFVPLALIWAAWPGGEGGVAGSPVAGKGRAAGRRLLLRGGPLLAGLAMVLAPVAARNAWAAGELSTANLISSQAGITFYQANNPRAAGVYVFLEGEGFSGDPRRQAAEERSLAEASARRPLTRAEVSRYWLGRGLAWIRANPGDFLVLEARKLIRYLGSYEYSTEYLLAVERASVSSLWMPFLPFAALSALALAGLGIRWRDGWGRAAALPALFLAASAGAALLFYISSRYRLQAVPALALFAALALDRILADLGRGAGARRRRGALLAAGVLAAALLLHPPLDARHLAQEATAHQNLGTVLWERGRMEESLAAYRRSLAVVPGNWRAHFGAGLALESLGRTEEARDAYRQALRLNPGAGAVRERLAGLAAGR